MTNVVLEGDIINIASDVIVVTPAVLPITVQSDNSLTESNRKVAVQGDIEAITFVGSYLPPTGLAPGACSIKFKWNNYSQQSKKGGKPVTLCEGAGICDVTITTPATMPATPSPIPDPTPTYSTTFTITKSSQFFKTA